jgi:hypothetical protein
VEDFKFLTNKIIDDELFRFIQDNIFTILFYSSQLHNKNVAKRNLYKIQDMSNEYRVFKMMLISYDTNQTNDKDIFEFIVFDGTNYIRLKIEKSEGINYEFDTLRCVRINMNVLDFYCRIRREHF